MNHAEFIKVLEFIGFYKIYFGEYIIINHKLCKIFKYTKTSICGKLYYNFYVDMNGNILDSSYNKENDNNLKEVYINLYLYFPYEMRKYKINKILKII